MNAGDNRLCGDLSRTPNGRRPTFVAFFQLSSRTVAVNKRNDLLLSNWRSVAKTRMRPVVFGEPLPGGTLLTLVSDDKPDRFFTVIKFLMDETSGVALALKCGLPSYQVEDEEGRTHLLIHLAIEEQNSGLSELRFT